jgi:hypothetical protein
MTLRRITLAPPYLLFMGDIDEPLLLKNDRLDGFIYDHGMVSVPATRFWG